MSTQTEATFASDAARELAAEHPDVELPERGSGSGGTLTKADVAKAVADQEPDSAQAPKVIAHGKPILTSGSGGPVVHELGALLAELGYESSVSRGENPFAIVDPSVLEAVQAFRRDHDVAEAVESFPEADRDRYVGPVTWQALLDATS